MAIQINDFLANELIQTGVSASRAVYFGLQNQPRWMIVEISLSF